MSILPRKVIVFCKESVQNFAIPLGRHQVAIIPVRIQQRQIIVSSVESEKYIAQLKELATAVTRLPRTPPAALNEALASEADELAKIILSELGERLSRWHAR